MRQTKIILLVLIITQFYGWGVFHAEADVIPTINFFTASAYSVSSGQPVTLSWSSFNGTSGNIQPSIGQVNASDSRVVTPTQTTTYVFTLSSGAGTVYKSLTILVPGSNEELMVFNGVTPPALVGTQQASVAYPVAGPQGTAMRADFFIPESGAPAISVDFDIPQNWTSFNGLQITLNPSTTPNNNLLLSVYDSQFRVGTLSLPLNPSTWQTLTYIFDGSTLSNMNTLPPGVGTVVFQSGFDFTQIKHVSFWLKNFFVSSSIYIYDVKAGPAISIVDSLGQYSGADWSGKAHNLSEMINAHNQENLQPAPALWDSYGGWANGPQLTGTGHFRTTQYLNRWWLVTPAGHLFFSTGMQATEYGYIWTRVGPGSRKALFDSLPQPTDPPLNAYLTGSPDRYNYYYANVYRSYGQANLTQMDTQWQSTAMKRLQSWGFNTLGVLSRQGLIDQKKLPTTLLSYSNDGTTGVIDLASTGYAGYKLPDVFSATFKSTADAMIGPKASACEGNSYCIGTYVDNEILWNPNDALGNSNYPGVRAILLTSTATKTALVNRLAARYGNNISAFNSTWGTSFASFSNISTLPTNTTVAQSNDLIDLLSYYSDAYYKFIADTYHKYSPNTLYLGSRIIPGHTPTWMPAIAACYADVVSYNLYEQNLAGTPWAAAGVCTATGASKPSIISEFGFVSNDRGLYWLPFQKTSTTSQADRAQKYSTYVQSIINQPAFVGLEWVSYQDEPLTGFDASGENGNLGFVSIADIPYSEMVSAASNLNRSIYSMLGSSYTPTPLVGDINLDHIVNSVDYSILNSHWFQNYSPADLNHDGIVNAVDFSMLNSNWFQTW